MDINNSNENNLPIKINNFSKKKKIIILVIVLFLVVDLGLFLYWYYRDKTPIVKLVNQECLAMVSDMDDEELIGEIKKLSKEGRRAGVARMADYMMCRLKYDKSEENYNKVIAFWDEIGVSDSRRQSSLLMLEKKYDEDVDQDEYITPDNLFTLALAVGELSEICPEKLSNLCLNRGRRDSAPLHEDWCMNLCQNIKNYSNNTEKFNEDVLNFISWSSDLYIMRSQYSWRSAVAFQIGRRELAMKVCDNVVENERSGCYELVGIFNNYATKNKLSKEKSTAYFMKCLHQREKVFNTVCSF